jgi:hypothetical protein
MVMEQATTNWGASTAGPLISTPSPYITNSLPTELRLRFTTLATPASSHDLALGNGNDLIYLGAANLAVSLKDCEFYGGNLKFWEPDVGLTNCLLARVFTHLYANHDSFNVQLRHCTFFKGSLVAENYGTGAWVFRDNIFDYAYAAQDGDLDADYNAYVTNVTRFIPSGSHDMAMTITNVTYESIAGLHYYLPTNSPFIDKGSMSGSSAGLFQCTVLTNQIPDTNTIDLGYHRVARNALLNAGRDTDNDGIADADEDIDGDGVADSDERHWYVYDSDRDYDGVRDPEDPDPDDPSVTVPMRLSYFRFNTNDFPGSLGEVPNQLVNQQRPASWSITAAYLNHSPAAQLRYRESEVNAIKTNANINCRNGTVRFWFKPRWNSKRVGGTDPQLDYPRLIEVGNIDGPAHYGWWALALQPDGNTLTFWTQAQGLSRYQWSTEIAWRSNYWNQIALTYSPSNIALYLNGELSTNNVFNTIGEDKPFDPVSNPLALPIMFSIRC